MWMRWSLKQISIPFLYTGTDIYYQYHVYVNVLLQVLGVKAVVDEPMAYKETT